MNKGNFLTRLHDRLIPDHREVIMRDTGQITDADLAAVNAAIRRAGRPLSLGLIAISNSNSRDFSVERRDGLIYAFSRKKKWSSWFAVTFLIIPIIVGLGFLIMGGGVEKYYLGVAGLCMPFAFVIIVNF